MVEREKELRIRLEFVGCASREIVMHLVRKRSMDGRLARVDRKRENEPFVKMLNLSCF